MRQEDEQLMSEYFDSAPGFFYTLVQGEDGGYAMPFASAGMRDLFGIEPRDVERDIAPFVAVLHPEDRATIFREIEASARDLAGCQFEFRIVHPQKGLRWIAAQSMPQRTEDGDVRWAGFMHDISDRKEIEQYIGLQEFVLDHAHEAVYLLNLSTWRFVYVNEAACRALGYSREELMGISVAEIDPDLTPEAGRALWEKVLANGSHTFEARHRRRDGSIFPVEIHGSMFEFEGQMLSLSLVRDITERKRAEMELRHREREFRSLAENLSDNIARWDTAGRILYSNPTNQRTLGRAASDLIGKTLDEVFPDGRYTPVVEAVAQVLATGQPVLFVRQPVPFENGETQIHDVNLVPEHDVDGNIVSVLGIGRDMTELYRVQNEIAAREREFRRQAGFHQSLLSGLRDAGIMLVVVENGCFVYTNDHYVGCQLGYAEGQLPGTVSFMELIHPDDRPRIAEMHRDRLAGKPVPTSYEIGALGGDGSRREYEFHVTLVPDTDPPQTLLLALDIAGRKLMESELRLKEFVLDQARIGVYLIDENARIIYVNDEACRALGYSREELLTKTTMDIDADNSVEKSMAIHRKVLDEGFCTFETRHVRRDGSLFPVEILASAQEYQGRAIGVALAADITGRKRAETELQRREREFRTLAENLPDVVVRYDRECRRTYVNQAWEKANGIAASEVIGKSPQELSVRVKPISTEFERMLRGVMETGRPDSMELNWRDETGGQVYFELRAIPEFDGQGKAASVLTVARDVSAAKAAQRQTEQFVANFPGFVYSYRMTPDGRGSFPFASPGIEKLYGLQPADVKDDVARLHALAHPDDAHRIIDALVASARTMTPAHVEYRICRPGLPERWAEFRSCPVREADGSIVWHGIMVDIDERKRAAEALEESERRMTRYFASTPGYFQMTELRADGSYAVPFASDGIVELFGLKPDDVKKNVAALVALNHPDDTEMVFGKAAESARDLTPYQVEYRIFHPHKGLRWIECIGSPERLADGGTRWYGFMHDITERKRASEQLVASQKMLADAQKLALLGSWDWDVALNRVEWSEMAYDIYTPDKRPAEPGFEDFKSSVHPDDLDEVVAAVQAAFERDEPFDLDHRVVSASRGVRTVHAHGKVFRDADGKPIRMVGTVQDITERKQMEAALQESEARYRHHFNLLQSMLESASRVSVFALDREYRYLSFNKRHRDGAKRLRGTDIAIGMNMVESIGDEEFREFCRRGFDRVLAGESIFVESKEAVVKDGCPVYEYNENYGSPIFDDEGNVVGLTVFAINITERKRIENVLRFIADPGNVEKSDGFLPDLARFLGEELGVRYVIIDQLADDSGIAETVALYADGGIAPNMRYALKDTPCDNVVGKRVCCYPQGVQALFPQDDLLVAMKAESYAGIPLWDSTGKPVGLIAVIDDAPIGDPQALLNVLQLVAPRVAAELERGHSERILKTREQEFRSLVENLPDIVVRYDRDARFVYVNPQFEAVLGASLESLLGKTPTQVPGLPGAEFFERQVKAAAQSGKAVQLEHCIQVADGKDIWGSIRIAPEFDEDGKLLFIQVVTRDLSERKQAEIALKERFDRINELNDHLELSARNLEEQAVELEASQEQLKQTEAWYRGIIHSAPEGMVVVNERGTIMLVNAQLEAMFGYGRGELAGIGIGALLPQDLRESHVAQCREYFSSGIGHRDAMTGKVLLGCRKDGTTFPVDVSLSRLPEIDGMGSAVCASVRDITARRAMEAARESALAEALRLAQLRSAFMAQMSHELRTPLNGILGYAQNLLLQGEALSEKQVNWLHIIQHSGEHLLSLINGILDHAAIEADKFELVPGDIELETFLGAIIGMIRIRAEQKNLAFACEVGQDLPAVVRGDAQRLRQVLLNLLANAIKFTDQGQVTLRVNFIAPSRLRFAVQDSGVGIAADQLENIFMPFEQVGELGRRAGGNGLGLAISRKLVRLMGGDIEVESKLGVGSTLSFEIEMECGQSGESRVNAAALSDQAATQVAHVTPLLFTPPRKELETLHGLALRGSMRNVIQHAEQLVETDERYQPFVEQLRRLAKGFQTRALVSLIAAYRDGANGPDKSIGLGGNGRSDE